MKYRVSSVAFRAALAAGLVAFSHGVASAADRTWTGAAGDGKWSTPGNWKGGGEAGFRRCGLLRQYGGVPRFGCR